MRISPEKLAAEAAGTGFRADVLEKVAHLLGLLEAIQSHPYLKGKLVLKGGTALNLFVFNVPRLSVDIDLNYVGAISRDDMLGARPKVEQALQAVFAREGLTPRRIPQEHAGGKWVLRYEQVSGQRGNLEVDINFMFRVPLWPATVQSSFPVGSWKAMGIPVLDLHELAAGKLSALFARKQARDLFDSHQLLQLEDLDFDRLRIGFVVYGAMSRKDWRTLSADDVNFDVTDFTRQLVPMLRVNSPAILKEPGKCLVRECRERLAALLPFTHSERTFLDLLLEKGIIDATLLTDDTSLQQRIQSQPLLEWKVLNVRQHKFGQE